MANNLVLGTAEVGAEDAVLLVSFVFFVFLRRRADEDEEELELSEESEEYERDLFFLDLP